MLLHDEPGAPVLPEAHLNVLQDNLATVARLVREFGGLHPSDTVVACVQRCRSRLQEAGVEDDLPARTEALARSLLFHPALLHRSTP